MFAKYVFSFALITLSMFRCTGAQAEVIVDRGETAVFFRVDGKRVSADQATAASSDKTKTVVKCTPVKNKNYETANGGEISAAFQCKQVVYMVSAKTGAGHWKSK